MAVRTALDVALAASKATVPAIGTAWEYAKVEMIPPMTHSFVHGPIGKNFEKSVAAFGRGIVSGIEGRIKAMDMEEERVRKEKEAAIKAAIDQAAAVAKAAAQAKAEEKKKKDAAKAKEAAKEEKKADTKAPAPKAAAPKAAAPAPKPEAKKAAPAKKKEPARKKEPKKHRREDKKGKPPKK